MGLINGVLQGVYSGCPAFLMAPGGVPAAAGPLAAGDLALRRDAQRRAELRLRPLRAPRERRGSRGPRSQFLAAGVQRLGTGAALDAGAFHARVRPVRVSLDGVPSGIRPRRVDARRHRRSRRHPPVFHSAGPEPAAAADAGLQPCAPWVSSGASTGAMRIRIVDPVTLHRREDGEVGEIWVAGESVALGYWNNPRESAATFRAFIAGTEVERVGAVSAHRRSRLHRRRTSLRDRPHQGRPHRPGM